MNVMQTIVAARGLSKDRLQAMWNPSRLGEIETPPPGYLHTVETVNRFGKYLHDDWTGKEMMVAMSPSIFPIPDQGAIFEDGILHKDMQKRFESKLNSIKIGCAISGMRTPSGSVFTEEYWRFAVSAQSELARVRDEAVNRVRKVATHIQTLCAKGDIASAYRCEAASEIELFAGDWNLPDIFERIKNCSVCSSDTKSTKAVPDATLFFREADVLRQLDSKPLAEESEAEWAERLRVSYVTPMLAALLDVVKALNASEKSQLSELDIFELIEEAGRKHRVDFKPTHKHVAKLMIRPEAAMKGVKRPEKLDLEALKRKIWGQAKR